MQYIIEVRDDRITGSTASGKPWPPAYWRGPEHNYVTGTKAKAYRFGSRDYARHMAEVLNENVRNHTFTVVTVK